MEGQYIITRNGEPLGAVFTSRYAAEYQLDHNRSAGGIWDGDMAEFKVEGGRTFGNLIDRNGNIVGEGDIED